MSDRDVEAALRRIASQGKAGQMTVAAPLNDAQFLSLITTMLHTAGQPPPSVESCVEVAMKIVAACKVAIVSGTFGKVLDEATGGPPVSPPAESGVPN